jgi:glutaredoxin 3
MKQVKIYTTSYCPYCKRAKDFFNSLDLPFEEIDVEHNEILRDELSKKYNWLTVPMIVIGDQFIGGFDDLFALHKNKKLLELVI